MRRPSWRMTTACLCLLAVIVLAGCAGLFNPAQDEFDKGLSFFNRGRFEEAAFHFEKAMHFDPEFGRAYLYLGRSYIGMRRWAEALQPLRTALRLEPYETRREIVNILIDALLAQAFFDFKEGNFLPLLNSKWV